MAGPAIVDVYAQVIEGDTREARKIIGHVARRAVQCCRHMRGVLADTNVTVMTKRAIIYVDSHVVENRTRKGHGVMTNRTIFDCRYVLAELTQSDHIIVA
jgi:hypothetical protein